MEPGTAKAGVAAWPLHTPGQKASPRIVHPSLASTSCVHPCSLVQVPHLLFLLLPSILCINYACCRMHSPPNRSTCKDMAIRVCLSGSCESQSSEYNTKDLRGVGGHPPHQALEWVVVGAGREKRLAPHMRSSPHTATVLPSPPLFT